MKYEKQIRVKYFLDRCFGIISFFILSPVILLIALAIKIDDSDAVFFRQVRPGLNGRLFKIWKFRTMIPDADRFLDEKSRVKSGNRITRVGKFLRYLSLDELAQVINIMKGEMSFVGPRPGLREHLQRYSEEQKQRLKMKPGITGLAQTNGRNTLKWSKRIEYDIEYIKNYSIWLDIKILFKTIKVGVLREGIVLDRNPEQVDDLLGR